MVNDTDLSQEDLKTLLCAGLIYASERTKDGRVTQYSLTGRGRIVLGNQLRKETSSG